MLEELREMVLEIVGEIPYGNVVSYKQLATLAGYPKHARLIGKIMSTAPYGYPCHRVLHSDGSLVGFWPEQIDLLKEEGVTFLPNGKVNMKKHQWREGNGSQKSEK